MRQFAAAALAVPVLLLVYLASVVRRPIGRVTALALVAGLGAIVWAGGAATPRTTANQPGPVPSIPVAEFRAIPVRQALGAPVLLSFNVPMDAASVQAALSVEPPAPVSLSFDATGTKLTIAPTQRWASQTYYTVTVGPSARDRSGQPLARPVSTEFLTRPPVAASLAATGLQAGAVPLDTRFVVTVEGDVSPDALVAAVRISPAVDGHVSVSPADAVDDASIRGGSPVLQAVFTPSAPLDPGKTYTVSLVGLVDADGSLVQAASDLVVNTAKEPAVVRFRPADGSTGVAQSVVISVRFTETMDRPSTQAAFSATVAGKAVAGSFDWAEQGHVLVFKPAKAFDYSQTVAMSVAASARSARGVPIADAASGSFTTLAKPAPKPTATPTAKPAAKAAPKPVTKAVPIPSGGTVAAGTWSAVEAYYLRLLNCTRTGGWVTSSGSCLPGSNGTPPLAMSAAIQTKVARPYAKVLATTGACSHTADGTFAYRLARGGFSGYTWAGENVGCGNGDPYAAMIADHLFFQNEKSTNGGHYRNIMDRRFTVVGVGVWVYGGRCRLVTDFLDP